MKKIYFLLLTVLFAATAHAQLTGIKTIPGTYPTIAAAVTDLNTQGVGAGGVIFNIAAGYTETAPSGGYLLGNTLLNASLSAANPLVFQKSGAGVNPAVTAFTGGTSINSDGIFKIQGSDYVTINGIDLKENAANSGAAFMEWGYALVNLNAAAPFDGCQNVTIQNCSITLDKTNPNGAFGIYSGHNIATNTTALTLTAAGDLHSNNKFYTNTIKNVNEGIWVSGFNDVTSPFVLYDQNNDVGGASAATGNTIMNTGTNSLFNCFGIYMLYQNNANASYNIVDNAGGGGAGNNTGTYGIYFFGTNATVTANSNNITLTQATGASSVYGVYPGSTGITTVTNNTIKEVTTGATTGIYYHIYLPNAAVSETINNNIFSNSNINTTTSVYCIYASNATPNITASGNSIAGSLTKTGAGGTVYGYYNFGSPSSGTATITGNNFSNISLTGATAFYGIYQATATTQIELVTNNTISNVTSGASTLIGIHHNYGAVGSINSGNTVSNIAGTATVTGIQIGNATASLGMSVFNNNVNTLSTTGASTVSGIIHTTGVNTGIYKNKIYNLQATNAAGIANGITISAGTTVNVYNNLVGDLRAPSTSSATDAVRGINITSGAANSSINLYYNTIYLNASSSGANFGASGVFHTTSTTATTANLTMRNNIIYNNSFANGTGFVSAFRRSSGVANTLNNYNAASNNNLFFAGTPAANRLIYYDGTSSAQTLAAYQAGVFTAGTIAPRDAASRTELSTPFLSTSGASANFLHINTTVQTVAESGGANIATFTDDYDGDVRNVATPDIGADEFTGLAVTACAGTPTAGSITGLNNICQGQFAILALSGYSANSGISIQWQSSAVSGGPYAPIAGETGTTLNTGVIPTGTTVYYVATVTCANGGANATTVQFSVTSNAAPTVTVNPPAPTICSGGAGVALTASGATTYTWSPATGLSATTGATVTANPGVTTTYTVIGTNAAGCTGTVNVTVTVNPAPVISSTTATPGMVCLGGTSQLQVNTSAPTFCASTHASGCGLGDEITNVVLGSIANPTGCGASAYTYFPPTATTTTTLAVGTPYTVTLSFGTDGNQYFGAWIDYNHDGTFSTTEFLGASVNAGASGTTSVNFTIPAGVFNGIARLRLVGGNDSPPTSAQGCGASSSGFGETEDYDITITGGVAEFTYSWIPAGTLNNATITNPVATPVATTTYTVTVTAGNGCTTTGNATVVVGTPVVSAVLVQPTTCVTTDGSITLTVSGGTGGVGPYTYAWVGTGVNPTSQNQVNLGVGSFTVTVTDVPSGCSNIITYSLPGPGGCSICPTIPTLTTNPTPAVCLNSNVTLTASGLTNMGVTYGITFKYSNVALADPYTGGTVIATVANGALTSGGTIASTTTSFAATGNYFIYAILSPLPVDAGCRPFVQTNLTVNPLPTVNAVANQSVCKGATTAAVNFTGAIPGTVYNWTNNTPAIGLAASGTGNIAPFVAVNNTGVAVVATITVTPTFTGGGTTCTGAPTTFTITVNPNLPLLIVAVPGTILCQGDPAALTVYDAGPISPVTVTHSSSNTITAGTGVSCGTAGVNTAINSYWRAYDLTTFPAVTGNFTINSVNFGIEQLSGGTQLFTVRLYNQTGGAFPGGTRTQIASQTFNIPVQALTVFTATFGTPVTVSNTSTIVVEVEKSAVVTGQFFFPGGNAAAETGPSYISAPACAINTPITYASIGFPNTHLVMALAGTVQGAGAVATGTFLWSPAAGLSSTTTNPVAASPAVTTTYTVVRTTPAGCIGSANITLNVNLRPTVTSQPANATICSGQPATFTITGTGTGITYQWQEAIGAGPFVNIPGPGTAPYAGVNTPTLTINPVTAAMSGNRYRCVLSGTCPPNGTANISNAATLTVNGLPGVTITPAGPVCGGVAGINGTQLSTASSAPPVPGTVTVNSATINLAVPDNTANGVSNDITMAGIPANATITNVSITLNMSHTYPGDMIFNLKAPNGQILNLYKYGGGLGTGPVSGVPTWGWYGAKVSQLGTIAWSTVAAAPFIYNNSTAWKADAINTPVVGVTVQNPTGFISAAANFNALYTTGPSANGTWTLAMADGGAGDVGSLASWGITIDYTTPGGTGTPLTYTWSPAGGLYLNSTATIPYIAGTQTPTVYAAPTALTVYTVTGTDGTTGCSNTASVTVNYTPPAPTVTPSAVTMCLGDPAVKLKSASSTSTVVAFNSGTISVPIPDNDQAGASNNITVSGIPANATVTGMRVKMTIPHTFIGDLVIALKAPNSNVLNLDYYLSFSFGGTTTGFSNTIITSAAGAAALSTGTNPYSAQFRPDGQIAATANGPAAPTGYTANMANFGALISSLTPANVNGVYTLAMYDGGAIDIGTLTNWEIEFTYVVGVPATPAVWSPAAGLYSDASASTAYVAGTAVDSVWARPTPSGVYPYTATVQSVSLAPAAPATPMTGGNGNNTVSFNITNSNAIAMTLTGISSNAFAAGAITARAFFKPSAIAGNPGNIDAANGWNQFGPSINSNVTAGALNPVLTGLSLNIPAGATYGIVLEMTGATFPAYTNGTGVVASYTNGGCTISTDGNIGWGGPAAPGPMVNNPRNFNGTVYLSVGSAAACTSPARTVIVTVNQIASVSTQPVSQTVCTDKVASFTVAAAGTGPFSYQWQVSTDNGNTFTNIANGGVYNGATSATLVITAPPVSMNNYQYRAIVQGAAPCGTATSFKVALTVNPLPVVVLSASPYTRLLPGLTTTLSSTVTPFAAAAGGYTWLRNGVQVPGANSNSGTLSLTVDNLGDYSLRVTDIHGCTNTSNVITIADSVSGRVFIYPNPSGGQFQVRYYSALNNVLPRGIIVYDAKGAKVFAGNYTVNAPYARMDVDLRKFGSGVYWIEVVDMNGNRLAMGRVVIQR